MGKGNIVYHNLRMNLDNEQHRRIHAVLADLNTDIHKSVNQFLIDAADAYIRRLGDQETVRTEKRECPYITKEEFEQVRKEIREELQREIIQTLGMALAGTRVPPAFGMVPAGEMEGTGNGREEEAAADVTTIGLASSWG